MKHMRNLLIPVLLIAALSGCDIIDQPKSDMATPTPPGGGNVTRSVLLEDCTGFLCTNCPGAATQAQQLKGIYGDRLVVVGVHMGQYAVPSGPNYTTDFRTPAGTAYKAAFMIDFAPAGLINRRPYNGVLGLGVDSWSSAIGALIDLPADMDMWLEPISYNSADNTVTGTVKVAILHPITGPHNLTIYLTEDHVIDWQLDGSTNVPNYDHRHVLRSALNSTWGEELITSSAQVGDTLSKTFNYPMPSNVLQPNNCALVAYVYPTSGAERYEVKQVTERKFVP